MKETLWHRIGSLASLADGGKLALHVYGIPVVVLRVGERVFAYEDRCPHAGAPLSDGRFSGGRLTCRHHQWQFDASTGRSVRPQGSALKSYAVKIESVDVFVGV